MNRTQKFFPVGGILLVVSLLTSALLAAAPAVSPNPAAAKAVAHPAILRPSLNPIDGKVSALLAKMTLEEKIGQMVQFAAWGGDKKKMILGKLPEGGIGSLLNAVGAKETNEYQKEAVEKSRLHIPLLFGLDVIHGFKTIFPISLAEDCAWNPGLLEKCASTAAHEAAAAGVRWTFAPMVDVSREPRWGRISEGSGEDPTLGSVMAAARVRGFQGKSLGDSGSIAACAKHFVGYGAAEAGREYNTTDMSEIALREIHLPPFKAAVDAGVRTFMSAFNDLNGVPASGNKHTLREILRGEWGFKGFVVSDWASVAQLEAHGFAADQKEATLKGVTAGVDMDMEGKGYGDHLANLVKEKKIPLALLNDAVSRILKVKFELGLFDHPYVDEEKEFKTMTTSESLDLALEEARQSIVLLKNDKNTLPLSKGLKTLAVIGVLADSTKDPLGPWHCKGEEALDKVVTVLKGIQTKVGTKTQVLYAPGVAPEAESAPQSLIDQAVQTAKKAQVAVIVAGERENMSGEAAARTSLSLPGKQLEMVKAIQATGVPVVLVLMNGRPLTIPWESDNLPAIVESWFLGTRQGDAVADVLFGDTNPSGKLVVTFPRNVGQVPIFYSHKNTGRPYKEGDKDKWVSRYIDSPNSPQYPFGYGLSYTTYSLDGLSVSSPIVGLKGKIQIKATVKNTGNQAGTEIVQLYIQDVAASITQPVKKLMDFKRVELAAGEEKTVEFSLPADKLGFYNEAGKYLVEPGKFNVWVAKDSADETLKGSFELVSK